MNAELLKFVEACTRRGEFEELGNSKQANKEYKNIHSLYLLLKKENRVEELLELLNHENPYVRLWAATYALQVSSVKAESALINLSGTKGNLIGLCAQMTLQEWKKGNLNFF